MTPFPHSIGTDAELGSAQAMMAEHGVHHLPVMSGGHLVGVVSQQDILIAKALAGADAMALRVEALGLRPPVVVDIRTPLGRAAHEMAEAQLGFVLVTREGKPVGILTTTDVCRALGDLLDAPAPPDEVG
jgi:CBS domain-containing protein